MRSCRGRPRETRGSAGRVCSSIRCRRRNCRTAARRHAAETAAITPQEGRPNAGRSGSWRGWRGQNGDSGRRSSKKGVMRKFTERVKIRARGRGQESDKPSAERDRRLELNADQVRAGPVQTSAAHRRVQGPFLHCTAVTGTQDGSKCTCGPSKRSEARQGGDRPSPL